MDFPYITMFKFARPAGQYFLNYSTLIPYTTQVVDKKKRETSWLFHGHKISTSSRTKSDFVSQCKVGKAARWWGRPADPYGKHRLPLLQNHINLNTTVSKNTYVTGFWGLFRPQTLQERDVCSGNCLRLTLFNINHFYIPFPLSI